MRLGNEGMTYVTRSGRFFIKSSPDRLRRKRPTRFIELTEALRRWAGDFARASSLAKTKRVEYEDRLLLRNLREAVLTTREGFGWRVAAPSLHSMLRRARKP